MMTPEQWPPVDPILIEAVQEAFNGRAPLPQPGEEATAYALRCARIAGAAEVVNKLIAMYEFQQRKT